MKRGPKPPLTGEALERKRERARQYSREWSAKNREYTRQNARKWRLENPDEKRELNKLWMRKKRAGMTVSERQQQHLRDKQRDPIGYLLSHAKHRAKSRGVPFDLTREDLVMPTHCPVLGFELQWGVGKHGWRNMEAPSLDRIKPQLGYVRGNVTIISTRANHLKGNGSIAELKAVLAYMERVGANDSFIDMQQMALPLMASEPQLLLL